MIEKMPSLLLKQSGADKLYVDNNYTEKHLIALSIQKKRAIACRQ